MSLSNDFRSAPRRAKVKFFIEAVIVFLFFTALMLGVFCHQVKKISMRQKEIPLQHAEPAKAIKEAATVVIQDSCEEVIPPAKLTDIPAEVQKPSIRRAEANAWGSTSVRPPLPRFDIAEMQETVNATYGKIITSAHQSQIFIPANAFVDSTGNIVKGDVEVRYREFHNYLDILRSGIPMKSDSMSDEQLESAGMIEITALQDNTPVYVNKDSKINVLLSTINRSPDYNIYYFDKQQRKWINKGKDRVITNQAYVYPDRSALLRGDSTETKFTFYPKGFYKARAVNHEFADAKRKSLFRKKKDAARFTFHLSPGRNTYPEIGLLSRFTWTYQGDDATDVYNIIFNADAITSRPTDRGPWKNLTIYPGDGGSYMLTMFSDSDTMHVTIVPQLTSRRSRRKFEKNIQEFLVAQQGRKEADREAFRQFQKDTSDYYALNSHYIRSTQALQGAASRQFAIDGFGIWNCDQPKKFPNQANVSAKFTDQNNKTLHPAMVYLVDKSKNTVYMYSGYELESFKYDPAADNLICAVLPGGKMGVIKPKELHDNYKQTSGPCTFKVIETKVINSEEDLKSLLAFN